MKIDLFEPWGPGNGSDKYHLSIYQPDRGDGVTLDEDEILQLYNELGSIAPKIIQRRTEKARSDEN